MKNFLKIVSTLSAWAIVASLVFKGLAVQHWVIAILCGSVALCNGFLCLKFEERKDYQVYYGIASVVFLLAAFLYAGVYPMFHC